MVVNEKTPSENGFTVPIASEPMRTLKQLALELLLFSSRTRVPLSGLKRCVGFLYY